jgi:hypothetical protein
MMSTDHQRNAEIDDLGTSANGAVDMHLTRHTEEPVSIQEPVIAHPGRTDVRTGNYKVKHNDTSGGQ